MTVREATPDDIVTVASLHVSEISQGFLARLGPRFLRILYRRIVRDPDSVLLVDDSEGICGFVAGTGDTGVLYRRFLLRDGLLAGVVALPTLVRSLPRVIETLRYPARARTTAPPDPSPTLPPAELLALAVAPQARGRGVATTLVAALLDQLREGEPAGVRVVVAVDNDAALRTYERAGFRRVGPMEVHAGESSEILVAP